MGKACLTSLFHRTRSEDLTNLAKQLPWHHPIARTLDHEVHRRKMAGKSCRFFFLDRDGSLPSYPFFSWFLEVFPNLDFRRQVLWPTHLCL